VQKLWNVKDKNQHKRTQGLTNFQNSYLILHIQKYFELATILIDDGKVDFNIKKDCGNDPLIATCQQTTLQTEEEAVQFIDCLIKSGSKFTMWNYSEKTAMNYAEQWPEEDYAKFGFNTMEDPVWQFIEGRFNSLN